MRPLRGRFYLGRLFAPHANSFLLLGQKKRIKEKATVRVGPLGHPALLPKRAAMLGCTDGGPGVVPPYLNARHSSESWNPVPFLILELWPKVHCEAYKVLTRFLIVQLTPVSYLLPGFQPSLE